MPCPAKIGECIRMIRESKGITQVDAAREAGITNVYLDMIEHGKSSPSGFIITSLELLFQVDLYIATWCLFGDVSRLPIPLREPMKKLEQAWRRLYNIPKRTAK